MTLWIVMVLDCDLKTRADTASFKFEVKNHRTILFEKGSPSISDDQIMITIDPDSRQIYVSEEYLPLMLNEESINWSEVNKLLNKE